jgi:hypothetical protein
MLLIGCNHNIWISQNIVHVCNPSKRMASLNRRQFKHPNNKDSVVAYIWRVPWKLNVLKAWSSMRCSEMGLWGSDWSQGLWSNQWFNSLMDSYLDGHYWKVVKGRKWGLRGGSRSLGHALEQYILFLVPMFSLSASPHILPMGLTSGPKSWHQATMDWNLWNGVQRNLSSF